MPEYLQDSSDKNISETTTKGETRLRIILPHKKEFLHCMESWRTDFSKHSHVQPSFGSWTSHTHKQVKVKATLPAEWI